MATKAIGPFTRRGECTRQCREEFPKKGIVLINDPSAGSPTETLLRLLLPLNDQVWITFRLWVVVADLPEPVRKPH